MQTINGFKKFLMDEITRKSNVSYSQAWEEVNAFSRTALFEDSFNKWAKISTKKVKPQSSPKSMKQIFNEMALT